MPMFLQLQFRADWLCTKPFSSEKRIVGIDSTFVPSKLWKAHELPTLYTPVNTIETLGVKRLVIQVKVIEGESITFEPFAYCALQMQELQKAGDNKYTRTFKGDVTGFNATIGTYECEVAYEVIDIDTPLESALLCATPSQNTKSDED